MRYEVRVEHFEPRTIAVVRRRCRTEELSRVVPEACGEVWRFIRSYEMPSSGRNLAVYLDGEINLECGVEVPHTFTSDGSVVCSTTPGGTVATAVHFGLYDRLGDAHRAVAEWCASRGYRFAGPSWEVYGHWIDDLSQLRTDVYWLLEGDGQPEAPR
jgi:effector-binding domain-containing protein